MNKKIFGISVVIPVYNRKEKLIRAVDSIESSDKSLVEIIVVDDCSEVSPKSFLGPYNKHGIKIRVYRNVKNSGPQISRNLGIRRAYFSYVAFLDSDDFFCPSKIDWLLNTLRNEDIDFLYHGVDGCEKYNKISRLWFSSIGQVLHFRWLLCMLNPCVTPSVVIKKKICMFNPSLRYAEDYAFFLSYVNGGGGAKVKYYGEIYTVVPREIGSIGGVSSNIIQMRKGELIGKRNILRENTFVSYALFFTSLLFVFIRILSDLFRRRYSIKEFIKIK
ncbi:glycosyltransferase family 2 protein [Aeromonas veronii]